MSMLKYFNNILLSLNPKDEKYALLSQVTGYLQTFTADNIEVGKFTTENFQIISFLIKNLPLCFLIESGEILRT